MKKVPMSNTNHMKSQKIRKIIQFLSEKNTYLTKTVDWCGSKCFLNILTVFPCEIFTYPQPGTNLPHSERIYRFINYVLRLFYQSDTSFEGTISTKYRCN